MERVGGIEPPLPVLKTGIITIIRHPQIPDISVIHDFRIKFQRVHFLIKIRYTIRVFIIFIKNTLFMAPTTKTAFAVILLAVGAVAGGAIGFSYGKIQGEDIGKMQGYAEGRNAGIIEEQTRTKAEADAAVKAAEAEAAQVANPFTEGTANPFAETANPFEEVKINPFK